MPNVDGIEVAPLDVIGDDGDLRQMRDALRAGKKVTLNSDGKVYVGADAATPMTADQEAFIEAKLGMVVEMARHGYGVSVTPTGTISAMRADQRGKQRLDMDKGFDEQDKILIQTAISDGAAVRLHPDGRVEYFLPPGARPPTGERARATEAEVQKAIDDGTLDKAWAEGKALHVWPNGDKWQQHVEYNPAGEPPPGIEFPEDVAWGKTPPTTSAQMTAEAEELELGAAAARQLEHTEFQDALTAADARRASAAQTKAASDAAAGQADRDLADATSRLDTLRAKEIQLAADMGQARDAGKTVDADELGEQYFDTLAEIRVAETATASAKQAAADQRAASAKATTDLAAADKQIADVRTAHAAREAAFDGMETQARWYRDAAVDTAEAERLEASYEDLKARNVPDADRVKDAAELYRTKASVSLEEAAKLEAPLVTGTPAPAEPTPVSPTRPVHPTPEEMQEFGPIGDAAPTSVGPSVASTDDDVTGASDVSALTAAPAVTDASPIVASTEPDPAVAPDPIAEPEQVAAVEPVEDPFAADAWSAPADEPAPTDFASDDVAEAEPDAGGADPGDLDAFG